MIKIIASGKVKAGKLEEVIQAVTPLVEGSRSEAGNVSYAFNQGLEDLDAVCFIEEWKDQDAIDFHNATEHFTTGVGKLGDLLDGDLVVTLYKPLV